MKLTSSMLTFSGTVLVILGSVAFMHSAWTSSHTAGSGTLSASTGTWNGFGPGPRILVFSPQDHDLIANQLELTPAQRERVSALLQDVDNGRDFYSRVTLYRQAYDQLTPEQQKVARTILPGHVERVLAEREAQARRTLSAQEFTEFEGRLIRARERLAAAAVQFEETSPTLTQAVQNIPKH